MARIGKSSVRIFPRKYGAQELVTVKTRIIHPQHNGRFKDAQGHYIPRHYITEFKAYYGDEEVMAVRTTPGIAVNPFFDFPLKITKSAPLKVVWKDNREGLYSKTIAIKIARR